MLRTVTLSLLMLVSVVVMLPFASSTAHGLRQGSALKSAAPLPASFARLVATSPRSHASTSRRAARASQRSAGTPRLLIQPLLALLLSPYRSSPPVGTTPRSRMAANSVSHRKHCKHAGTGQPCSRCSQSSDARLPHPKEQRTMLSGVSFSDLRRIAIDKMINAGGWVINDYERQVNGTRVFVVIAQTPSDGRSPEKSWNFYFAEVDGKIYSLTLNTPVEFSGRLAAEGERFISSLAAKAN